LEAQVAFRERSEATADEGGNQAARTAAALTRQVWVAQLVTPGVIRLKTMDNDVKKPWENFLNPKILRSNLIVSSVFLSAFEMLKGMRFKKT